MLLIKCAKQSFRLILLAALAAGGRFPQIAVAQESAWPHFLGYSRRASKVEAQWEAKFRAIPSAERIRAANKFLSAYPHAAGSARDRQNAYWILSKFKEWGWNTHIEKFDVLLPYPKERLVELVSPDQYKARLEEPAIAVDPTSSQHSLQFPTYNMYAADGDVTAPLVYVNYGMKQDYEELARMGISVKGDIVIARYGNGWRGLKPKLAAEHGAVGCLIYSDPRDDGYWQGNVYPAGPWRPRWGVQRGSVMDMLLHPGDPLTPGVGATQQAHRLALKNAKTILKVPVLPLSYGDAQPLLSALGGPVAPAGWRGALPITYHVGPGPARVHLKLVSSWNIKPIYDVVARIPGATDPGEWIIRGNHEDAWVNGSWDPVSGLTPMLEEARALGILVKEGWRPSRTIIYCVWDGEEPGLLGSTAWVEKHASDLSRHAAVYINSDSNGRGFLFASGSPSLEKFVNQVARDVQDPEKKMSVEARLRFYRIARTKSEAERRRLREGRDLRIGALGSGSDYSAFYDHLGIASLDLEFSGESPGGIYHSAYDDFYWYSHFGDPTFVYGRALAETAGSAVMRLADAPLLPFDFADLAASVKSDVNQVETGLRAQRREAREHDLEMRDGAFAAVANPCKPFVPSVTEAVPPRLDLKRLDKAVSLLTASANAYEKVLREVDTQGNSLSEGASLTAVNQTLLESERALASPGGLPGRPWYRQEISAPGLDTGYAAETLPALRDAIEEHNWNLARREMGLVKGVLDREATSIHLALSKLEMADRQGI